MKKLILAAALAISPALATDYYVTPSGSGTTCSIGSPCALPSVVIANKVLAGGDTVHIAAGTYYESAGVTVGGSDDGTSTVSRVVFSGAGVGSTFIVGLNSTAVDDDSAALCDAPTTDCGGGLDYANTYRINIGSRTIRAHQVWETTWDRTRVLASDDSTEASYRFDYPVPYVAVADVATVATVSGSYYYSDPNLYVHTWTGDAPSVATTNIETGNLAQLWYFNGASYTTIENMTLAYGGQLLYYAGGTFNIAQNLNILSGIDNSFALVGNCDDFTMDNVLVSSCQYRKNKTTASAAVDWGNGTTTDGECITITGAGATIERGSFTDITMHGGWNGWSIQQFNTTTMDGLFLHGSTNHVFRIPNSSLADCTGTVIKNSVFLNGQDTTYLDSCRNVKFSRNLIGSWSAYVQPGCVGCDNSGLWLKGNIFHQIESGETSGNCSNSPINVYNAGSWTGFQSDYNWFPGNCGDTGDESGDGCAGPGGTGYACQDDASGTDWPDVCEAATSVGNPCDRNSSHTTTVVLAGVTWSFARGTANDTLTRADFYPTASSTATIDLGDPDIDLDGTVETGSGQDDECTVAHHCYGSAPDIGPFEYGIDTPAAPSSRRRAHLTIPK